VRYRLTSEPMFVHCCHCRDCQQQTGGAFAVNALIETDRIELTQGRPAPVSLPTDSGRPHDVYRCEACATALWSDYGRRPAIRFVRATTLDDRGALSPDVHIFTRTKLPWVGPAARGPGLRHLLRHGRALAGAEPVAPARGPGRRLSRMGGQGRRDQALKLSFSPGRGQRVL